jgi:hypothetical protein
MVTDDAQLYTIEGVAAALIMILTTYLVLNAATVYTPGDSHISDMQLEVLGNDALKVMDTPQNFSTTKSQLKEIVETEIVEHPLGSNNQTFNSTFLNLTNFQSTSGPDHIQLAAGINRTQFTANYTCRNQDGTFQSYSLSQSRNLSGGEHTVRSTKWLIVNKPVCDSVTPNRAVLVEVLLWKD